MARREPTACIAVMPASRRRSQVYVEAEVVLEVLADVVIEVLAEVVLEVLAEIVLEVLAEVVLEIELEVVTEVRGGGYQLCECAGPTSVALLRVTQARAKR